MRILNLRILIFLMILSLNCKAQQLELVKINNISIISNDNQTISIHVPKGNNNEIRKIDIIGVLSNCSEYCLNLNNKSEIVVRGNKYATRWCKAEGRYLMRVTIEEITIEGTKKMFFEEKYFNIM